MRSHLDYSIRVIDLQTLDKSNTPSRTCTHVIRFRGPLPKLLGHRGLFANHLALSRFKVTTKGS